MNMTYENCRLCPRECGVNRTAGELGFCGCPDTALVAKTMLHKWEEPVLAGSGGSGAQPVENCTPRVLDKVIIPKNITVHLGKPAASARNVTVSFRDYIANVASSEVYPTWADENNPTGHPELFSLKNSIQSLFFVLR